MLQRVRAALNHAVTAPPAPGTVPVASDATARLVAASDELADLFIRNAQAVGMQVQRVAEAGLWPAVAAILRSVNAQHVAVDPPEGRQALVAAGFDVCGTTPPPLDIQFDLDAGVTGVEAAVVETGSLVCTCGAGRSRGLSLIPPVHVAIVRRADFVPDLLDLWSRLRQPDGSLPSSATIITGPSKTADIEGILVTGVHGPEQVHVLVVD